VIVVDASAAVLGLLNDGDARAALASGRLACPHLVDAEVLHTLRAQVIRGVIDEVAAESAIEVWGRLGVERIGASGLLDRVWALRQNLTAYDATYVAVAEALDAALLTADGRLARAPGPRCPITVVRR
jgi:predicted nucleic acid-binding protein